MTQTQTHTADAGDETTLREALELIISAAENPTVNPLETGFRHSPLTQKEIMERLSLACEEVVRYARAALAASPAPAASAGGEGATSTSETAGEGATSPVQDGAAPACGSSEGSPWSERAPSETTRLQEAIAETMEHAGKDPAQAFLRRTLARRREEEDATLAPAAQVNPGRGSIARIIDPEAYLQWAMWYRTQGEGREQACAEARAAADYAETCWNAALAKADAILDARPVAEGDAEAPKCVRHVKRGTEYEVLGEAEAQVAAGISQYDNGWKTARFIKDGDRLTVYRGSDGKLWCRFTDEFRDGRFVPAARPTPSPAKGGN